METTVYGTTRPTRGGLNRVLEVDRTQVAQVRMPWDVGGALIQPANENAADGPLFRRERLSGLLEIATEKPRGFRTLQ